MTPVRRKRMTHLKILVVDDEQLVQWYLGRALKIDGHEIMTAGNVQDASAKLGSEAVDVLVADLKMRAKLERNFRERRI